MKYFFTLLIFISLINNAYSQHCKCENELDFVIDYIENNLPGFIDNVNDTNKRQYESFKEELKLSAVKNCDNRFECLKNLMIYVEYFKDNHTEIYDNNSIDIDKNDSLSVAKFLVSEQFRNSEVFDIKKQKIRKKTFSEIENVYQFIDSSFTIAIVKDKKSWRDYIGVILESKSQIWQKGQIRFELKQKSKNTFDMFYYDEDHSLYFIKNISLKDGVLDNDFFNVNLKKRNDFSRDAPNKITFRFLDDSTSYIRISTFSGDMSAQLKAFYEKIDKLVKSRPYLIIDIRNNGGGSTDNAYPLLQYIYSKPFYNDNIDIYATEENIRKWEMFYKSAQEDTINYEKEYLNELLDEITRMKKARNQTFIKRTDGEVIELDTVLAKPKKAAIIMNRNTASSAESFVLWAMESDKTIIVGENSGGYIGYGEITETETPNFKFKLACTITRYEKQRAFEEIGVSPKFYLNNESDWIEQTLKILKQ